MVPNYRLILGRNPMVFATYTGHHLLRSKAETYVLSENAPRWTRKIAFGYRALRLKAARRVRRRSE
jgi:hypothetical protein